MERAIQNAVMQLGNTQQAPAVTVADVKAQWTAFNPSDTAANPEPSGTEKEKYARLSGDSTSKTTILYAHGG